MAKCYDLAIMNFDLKKHTILLTLAGSRAYGTSTSTSDVDLKGVCIPPVEYFLGFLAVCEQAEKGHVKCFADLLPQEHSLAAKDHGLEGTVYDVRKYFRLAADGNPNILEVVFADDADRYVCTPSGQKILSIREKFLSKKILYTYRGYAVSQLKRIKTHRKWLLDPPSCPPSRQEFGLPDKPLLPKDQLLAAQSFVRTTVDGWEIDFGILDEAEKIRIQDNIEKTLTAQIASKYYVAGQALGFDSNFLEILDKEQKYKAAQRHWEQYQEWKTSRNQARASLEEKYGYDTKHASHLFRLLSSCEEILTKCHLSVRLPEDQKQIACEIRNGTWPYDRLLEWADQQDVKLLDLAKVSNLPHSPDRKFLDVICQDVVTETLFG